MPGKAPPSDLCISFPPFVGAKAHTLILGSMPGARALAERKYYAHPHNAFWKIMTALFDMPIETFPQRKKIILTNQLAIWDVLKSCERAGSLDSAIKNHTIVVNDFATFFKKYSTIRRVFFNGTKAEQEFNRRVLPTLPDETRERLSFARLPATSPANASLTFKSKLAAWRVIATLKR